MYDICINNLYTMPQHHLKHDVTAGCLMYLHGGEARLIEILWLQARTPIIAARAVQDQTPTALTAFPCDERVFLMAQRAALYSE
ncbi:hypothetical protein MJO28_015095 [Puccinia striiformis f. sp. tritici]|uniref:Uncharacterized protein n=4 Tax=Puccinia striiformis TaxID=27350 RepID=A0A0L0UTT0_9BASI